MTKPKANISLLKGAEVRSVGWRLALRKGFCELRRPGKRVRTMRKLSKGVYPLRVSVILCTTGNCPVLAEAIEAALRQTMKKEEYEVLLVWNGTVSADIVTLPSGVRVINEPMLGLSYARNKGAKEAQGELLLYLDDDAVAAPDLVEKMAKAAARHPKAAIFGGQIFLETPIPRPKVILSGKEGLWSEYRVPYRRYRTVREQYAFPYGACFAVRHDALMQMGGFPVNYGRVGEDYAGGEETALCFLALRYGWQIGIQPDASVVHRVEPRRFNAEHIRQTVRAGILTTYRLYRDGYAPRGWDLRYVKERISIAEQELNRLQDGSLETYYKQCEMDAFLELCSKMQKEGGGA